MKNDHNLISLSVIVNGSCRNAFIEAGNMNSRAAIAYHNNYLSWKRDCFETYIDHQNGILRASQFELRKLTRGDEKEIAYIVTKMADSIKQIAFAVSLLNSFVVTLTE